MMRCYETNKLQMRFLKKTKTQKSLRSNNPTKVQRKNNSTNKTKQSNNESTVLWFFCFSVCKTEDWR